ncbi:uncharacterized protein ARMOST_04393 [Armillaria ostoyae]|uniref:MYND-type domain-containing protein n=1 Tax=Armillaria ostoyae TaxID=47428 RepID=A0A284QX96_ARMOS|nr:uncharacterized protein ARMOST_04393 [Armillaria ostoyae]
MMAANVHWSVQFDSAADRHEFQTAPPLQANSVHMSLENQRLIRDVGPSGWNRILPVIKEFLSSNKPPGEDAANEQSLVHLAGLCFFGLIMAFRPSKIRRIQKDILVFSPRIYEWCTYLISEGVVRIDDDEHHLVGDASSYHVKRAGYSLILLQGMTELPKIREELAMRPYVLMESVTAAWLDSIQCCGPLSGLLNDFMVSVISDSGRCWTHVTSSASPECRLACLKNIVAEHPANHSITYYIQVSRGFDAMTLISSHTPFRRELIVRKSLHWSCFVLSLLVASNQPPHRHADERIAHAKCITSALSYLSDFFSLNPSCVWTASLLRSNLLQVLLRAASFHRSVYGQVKSILDHITSLLIYRSVLREASRSVARIQGLDAGQGSRLRRDVSGRVWNAWTALVRTIDEREALRAGFLSLKPSTCDNPKCAGIYALGERAPRKICTGCVHAQYCSRECQRTGWSDGHGKVCAKIKKERMAGYELLSSHDIAFLRAVLNNDLHSNRTSILANQRRVQPKGHSEPPVVILDYTTAPAMSLSVIPSPVLDEHIRELLGIAEPENCVRKQASLDLDNWKHQTAVAAKGKAGEGFLLYAIIPCGHEPIRLFQWVVPVTTNRHDSQDGNPSVWYNISLDEAVKGQIWKDRADAADVYNSSGLELEGTPFLILFFFIFCLYWASTIGFNAFASVLILGFPVILIVRNAT